MEDREESQKPMSEGASEQGTERDGGPRADRTKASGAGRVLPPDTRMLLEQVVEKLEDRVDQGPSVAAVQRRFPELEVRELVGRGGMASVYKAWDPKLERHLAIKVLDESLAQEPDFAERFAREARTLAGLQHPNVLRPLDYGERDGMFFLLSEYFGGGNLAQHLRDGTLSADRALSLLREIAGALAYAHEQGIVHRDLKPSNILIDDAGHVCLADFGIVHLQGERKETLALTRTHQALGTPHYLAPEMLRGDGEVSASADVYALGVTAYEMLTGRLPIGRFDPPSRWSLVGSGVDAAIDRCLKSEPEDRWKSVRDFIHALDEKVAHVPQTDLWPRAWKWALACLAGFVLIEAMDVLLRLKTGEWKLPPSFGASLALTSMIFGWMWFAIERVWPEVPAEKWLRPFRTFLRRWLRGALLAFSACVLLLILGTAIERLHPGAGALAGLVSVQDPYSQFLWFWFPQAWVIMGTLAALVLELVVPGGLSIWRERRSKRAARSEK